jgi:hypothetical protein
MKKHLMVAAVCAALGLGIGWLSGCKAVTANTPPQALAAGASNQTDEQINAVLEGFHAAVAQAQADIASGKFTPTPAYKAALNTVIAALNQADPIYQSWHTALATNPSAAEPTALVQISGTLTADLLAVINTRN